jgi:hypothetical protein
LPFKKITKASYNALMNKLKIWNDNISWEESERNWEANAYAASLKNPLKVLKTLPSMPGMAGDTAKNLKWKSLKWMVTKDHNHAVFKGFFRHPLKYGVAFLKSAIKKKSFKREDDFFFYGIDSVNEFEELLRDKNSLFVVGFSYCHKPFECPSGRFNSNCIHDPTNSVCQQCFIGKSINTLPSDNSIPLIIPTIHYIGAKIFEIVHSHPHKKVIFIITACEMTLEMFGDWGNMVSIKGIGVRLDGRICNTMKAFELSEQGIKPGLTVVLDETQTRMMSLLRKWRERDLISTNFK